MLAFATNVWYNTETKKQEDEKMTYVTSDLHGFSLERFLTFLSDVGFGEDDYLFILGDVIDRGEDGVKILKWLLVQPNVELILGNHEAMLLACDFLFQEVDDDTLSHLNASQIHSYRVWKSNGAEPTLRALRECSPEERADILDYLRNCPLYDTVSLDSGEFLLVHGGLDGFDEERAMDEYDPHTLLWSRPTPDDVYSNRFLTIVGHTPTHFFGEEYRGKALRTKTFINIDTGCSSGGTPMLLCLDTMQEFYVQ